MEAESLELESDQISDEPQNGVVALAASHQQVQTDKKTAEGREANASTVDTMHPLTDENGAELLQKSGSMKSLTRSGKNCSPESLGNESSLESELNASSEDIDDSAGQYTPENGNSGEMSVHNLSTLVEEDSALVMHGSTDDDLGIHVEDHKRPRFHLPRRRVNTDPGDHSEDSSGHRRHNPFRRHNKPKVESGHSSFEELADEADEPADPWYAPPSGEDMLLNKAPSFEEGVTSAGQLEKRRFHLPHLRKHNKNNSLEMAAEFGESMDFGGEDVHTPTGKHRNLRPFGRHKNKSPLIDDEIDGTQDSSRKPRPFRLNRGPKGSASSKESDDPSESSTRKEKVAEQLQKFGRKIKSRAGNPHNLRMRLGSKDKSEFGGLYEFDESDSELLDEDYSVDVDSQFDGKSIHGINASTGFFPEHTSGSVSPPPVKDGVPLRGLRHALRKEHRVKPFEAFAPNKVYMTEEELYHNMLQPTEVVEHQKSFVKPWARVDKQNLTDMERQYWGSPEDGRIGSMRAEVLGCVGLTKHKPDAQVYMICGDAAFATDVIKSSRSPMWPAAAKRASCFPIFHAFARLYVGVFDVLERPNENDVFCGRVVLDISDLRPNSEYDVTLPLRASSFVYDRRPRGVVRLRFSLHWFSERAAVLSYLKTPRNMMPTFQCLEQPSIPCADPKTFRNAAITLHGQDLPGKYSRKAFQATMREFNLYQQNIRSVVQTLLHDLVFYEKPLASLYVLIGWMHCVIYSSVRLAPVYFVGFLIILLLEGYVYHNVNSAANLGYTKLSVQEVMKSLVQASEGRQMQALLAEKKVKAARESENDFGIELMDHREFPYSERNEYKKLRVQEALVRRNACQRKDKREALALQGRLSIYVKAESIDTSGTGASLHSIQNESEYGDPLLDRESTFDQDSGEQDGDSDVDVHGDDDNVFNMDVGEEEFGQGRTVSGSTFLSATSSRSSVVAGPPQNTDVKPKKKVPPQVHLARLEDKLNSLTQSLSMDKVFSATLAYRPGIPGPPGKYRGQSVGGDSVGSDKKGKRQPLDEFDKRLGYRVRHPNPVSEITASFLGPLMRIFRILCVAIRVLFNIGIWRDPFLSFWVLCSLFTLLLILVVFPWRIFLFIIGAAGFGPQNFIVGRRLKRKAEAGANPPIPSVVDTNPNNRTERADSQDMDETDSGRKPRIRLPNALRRRNQPKKLPNVTEEQSGSDPDDCELDVEIEMDMRPAFSARAKSRKQTHPRELVVPYSRFRKERFYDWPPDPTVARATPVQFEDCEFEIDFSELSSRDLNEYMDLRQATKETENEKKQD